MNKLTKQIDRIAKDMKNLKKELTTCKNEQKKIQRVLNSKKKSPKKKSPKKKSPKKKSPKKKSPSDMTYMDLRREIKNSLWFMVTLEGCGACEDSKKLLKKKGNYSLSKYEMITLTSENDKKIFKAVDILTNKYRYFPMIFHEGKFLGGYDELKF